MKSITQQSPIGQRVSCEHSILCIPACFGVTKVPYNNSASQALLSSSASQSLCEDEEGIKPMSWTAVALTAYCMFSTAAMMVLLRVWGIAAGEYAWTYSFSWSIGFVPFFGLLLLFLRFGPHHVRTPPSALDNWKPVMRQSGCIAFLYAINYLGISTSTKYLSGPVQAVLSQIPLILAMLLSSWGLKRKYSRKTWLAGLVVFASVIIVVLVKNEASQAPIAWALLYLLGNLPLGVLPLTFEAFHKARASDGRRITPEKRLLVTNVLLAVFLVVLIPLFAALRSPSFAELDANFSASFLCIFTGKGGMYVDNQCNIAGPVLLATIIVAAAQQHSQVLLSRHKTGMFAQMALILAPYLSDVIFPLKFVMGQFQELPSEFEVIGAIVGLAGVIAYVVFEHEDRLNNNWVSLKDIEWVKWFLEES